MSARSDQVVRDGLPVLLPRLWRFAITLCRNAAIAEDLVQATCVRALERSGQFEPGTRLDRWTFAIMASIWKNELRARKVRTGNGMVPAEELASNDMVLAVETTISARQVLTLASKLPEGQRAVVLLVYVEECSYKQVADILEIPIGTVMSRLAAARVSLASLAGAPQGSLRSELQQ